jgi:hypothetical protein
VLRSFKHSVTFACVLLLAGALAQPAQADTATGSPVFTPAAHPLGVSMQGWSERWWQWTMSAPWDTNPNLDPTGANCAVGQPDSGVWYLGNVGTAIDVSRTCTVPAHRVLVLTLAGLLNDYPCPDPAFQPAPGETLEHFLTEGAKQAVDTVDGLTLKVDGVQVQDIFQHRVTTGLFTFTGDLSLLPLDSCITGTPQQAVSDAYVVAVEPLRPGTHTIVWTTHDTAGHRHSVSYLITV